MFFDTYRLREVYRFTSAADSILVVEVQAVVRTEFGDLSDREIAQTVHAAFPICERKRRRGKWSYVGLSKRIREVVQSGSSELINFMMMRYSTGFRNMLYIKV